MDQLEIAKQGVLSKLRSREIRILLGPDTLHLVGPNDVTDPGDVMITLSVCANVLDELIADLDRFEPEDRHGDTDGHGAAGADQLRDAVKQILLANASRTGSGESGPGRDGRAGRTDIGPHPKLGTSSDPFGNKSPSRSAILELFVGDEEAMAWFLKSAASAADEHSVDAHARVCRAYFRNLVHTARTVRSEGAEGAHTEGRMGGTAGGPEVAEYDFPPQVSPRRRFREGEMVWTRAAVPFVDYWFDRLRNGTGSGGSATAQSSSGADAGGGGDARAGVPDRKLNALDVIHAVEIVTILAGCVEANVLPARGAYPAHFCAERDFLDRFVTWMGVSHYQDVVPHPYTFLSTPGPFTGGARGAL